MSTLPIRVPRPGERVVYFASDIESHGPKMHGLEATVTAVHADGNVVDLEVTDHFVYPQLHRSPLIPQYDTWAPVEPEDFTAADLVEGKEVRVFMRSANGIDERLGKVLSVFRMGDETSRIDAMLPDTYSRRSVRRGRHMEGWDFAD